MRLPRRTVVGLLACGLALPLAACSSSGESPSPPAAGPTSAVPTGTPQPASGSPSTPGTNPPPPAPVPPPSKPSYVSLERTGGIAGRVNTVVVQPDGKWLFTGGKAGEGVGKPQAGKLTADQQSKLQALLADPKLVEESRIKRGPADCRDGFHYTLTTGALLVAWDECSSADAPATAAAVVRLLAAATPL